MRILAALLIAASVLTAARAAEPTGPVEHLQSTLIEAMRGGERLGFNGRRDLIAPAMDAAFDMDAISRRIIGRWWDGLDDAMRAALVQRLRRYAVAVLASRFDAHDGERFETGELREVTADSVTVRSLFHRPADPPVQLDYALLRGAAGWRIVDVWFDGVSGTRIQHDEFAAFLRRGGAEQLLRRLDEVSARLESGG
jgi:phospholipid transport system substrate-binding protein